MSSITNTQLAAQLGELNEKLGPFTEEVAEATANANAAAERADAAVQTDSLVTPIYVNANAAADADERLTSSLAAPYMSIGRALEDVRSLRNSVIYLMSDVIWDVNVRLSNFFGSVQFSGVDGAGAGTVRKITVSDDVSSAARPGGLRLTTSQARITFFQTDIDLGSQYDAPMVSLDRSDLVARFFVSDVTSLALNQSSLFARATVNEGSNLRIAASSFTYTDMDGKIVDGIAHGTALSTIDWVQSHLTQF